MTQNNRGPRVSGPALEARSGEDGPAPQGPLALLIGDDGESGHLPDDVFHAAGCRLMRAETFDDAHDTCFRAAPDLVFMPLTMDGKPTTDQLRRCLRHEPSPVVVVTASNEQINTAAEAMRLGAYDCLFKPFSGARLTRTIEEAMKQLGRPFLSAPSPPRSPAPRAPRAHQAPRTKPKPTPRVSTPPKPQQTSGGIDSLSLARRGFVASSWPMQALLEKTAAVATSDAPVFITGEVGTGKTTLAGIIHELSPNASQPLVTLSCATLSAQGFDEVLSGPGGALSRAAGGTLYLDEIADLPGAVQPQVLRLVERIESGVANHGTRIIASTGQDPQAALREGRIRPDLFFRLHVVPIDLPPLRNRGDDTALIARVRLAEFSENEGHSFVGFSETALAMISSYSWPGNLRELVNVVWSVVLMNRGPLVTPDQLPSIVRAALPGAASAPIPSGAEAPARELGETSERFIGMTLAEVERMVIEATIRAEDGSVPRAAKVLDVSPSTLYRKREAWLKRDE